MHEYKFPMPAVTADIITFRVKEDDRIEILLIQRGKDPQKGSWALIGGHLDVLTDPSIRECARRELKEETNIDINEQDLYFIDYRDEIGRDPRGRYITFVFSAECPPNAEIKAGDDAVEFKWFDLHELLADETVPLAFDHRDILLDFAQVEPFSTDLEFFEPDVP